MAKMKIVARHKIEQMVNGKKQVRKPLEMFAIEENDANDLIKLKAARLPTPEELAMDQVAQAAKKAGKESAPKSAGKADPVKTDPAAKSEDAGI